MLKNYQVVYIGLELLIALLAVAGNVLVCWSVCLNSNLQTITNFFVVSLAVADIAVGLLAIPFAITISVGFCADFYGCLFIACFVLVLTQSSIFSLLAIAVDRYIAIKNPLRYNSLVTAQRAKGIITLCWTLSVGIGLTPLFGWNTGLNSTIIIDSNNCTEGMTLCFFEKVVTLDYMIYFNFFGCVLLPLLVMLVIYVNIFIVARRQLRMMCIKVAHLPAPGLTERPSSSPSHSFLQKEVHAAKSLAIILGLFALCWLPVHIINCFNHLCKDCERPHIWVMNIAIILSHANSVVNPCIYAYRIPEFQQTFRKIFHQNILRQAEGHRTKIGCADSGNVGITYVRRTSQNSGEVSSSCGSIVNSYILDPDTDQKAKQELSNAWTSHLELAPSSCISNGLKLRKDGSSVEHKQQFMMCSVQSPVECTREATDVSELKERSGITFINAQALSLNKVDCADSTDLAEVLS